VFRGMPDSDKSVFISAVIRIEELNRLRINPNGLGLFEPNPVFLKLDRFFCSSHSNSTMTAYSIVYTTSTKTQMGIGNLLPRR
jgi:hypothetical protein